MPSGLLTDYLGQGLIAARPTTPDTGEAGLAFWFATDTEELSLYDQNDNAWQNVSVTVTAAGVTFTPAGGLAATDVQAALVELDTEKMGLAGGTFTGDVIVPDDAYDATTWNGNAEVPTKNAVRDKIESLGGGGSTTLAALTDVDVTGVADGDVLTYDSGTGDWVAAVPTGGGGGSWDSAPPLAASFTTTSGDATNVVLTDDSDIGLIVDNGGAALGGNVHRFGTAALVSAGAASFSVKTRVKSNVFNNNTTAGLCLLESATGKHILFGFNTNVLTCYYGTLTTYNTQIFGYVNTQQIQWLRVDFNFGTGIYTFFTSADGKAWMQEATIAATTPFTTRASRVGFGFQNGTANTRRPLLSVPYFSLA